MSDWTIRVWYKLAVQPAENQDDPFMYRLKEFQKGEELKVAEWVLINREQFSDCIITDGSKQIKYTLEAR